VWKITVAVYYKINIKPYILYMCCSSVRRIQCGFLRFSRFEQYSRFSHCYLFVYIFFYDIFRKRFPRILSCVQILWYAPPSTTMWLSPRRSSAAVHQSKTVFFFRLSYYFSLSSSLWFFWHTRNIGHDLAQNSKRLILVVLHTHPLRWMLVLCIYICGHGCRQSLYIFQNKI